MPLEKAMVYAPVIIPTLCRDKHFIRCMESLRRNPWARYTEVYVGLDYPAKEEHWEGYRRIDEYLRGAFPEFRAVYVFRREKNEGAARNSSLLREEVTKQFDRFIFMEDDLEVSPNFLEYMDKALLEYEDDPDVIMVSGYSYPVDWKAADGCTVTRQCFNSSAWGRGIWKSKREKTVKYLQANGLCKDFSKAYYSGRFQKMIDNAVKDYTLLCEGGWSGKNGFLNNYTDVALRILLAVKDKYAIMPLLSKVRNHGYDGSGLYCQRIEGDSEKEFCVENYCFSAQPIDKEDSFSLTEDKTFNMKENRDLLNQFDRISPDEMENVWKRARAIARRGKYGGALLLGKKAVKKMISCGRKQ